VLTVLNILEDGLLLFLIPADNVDEAGLITELTAYAFFGVK
jgi:hypothetical protein